MVDHELDELRREFLSEAKEKAAEMRAAAVEADLNSLERVAYLAHQLKGSGGSYGYPSISDNAAELERVIEASGGNSSNGVAETVRSCVEALLSEIDARAAELG